MDIVLFWLIMLQIDMVLLVTSVSLVVKYGSDPSKPHRRLLLRIEKLYQFDSPYDEVVDFDETLDAIDTELENNLIFLDQQPQVIGYCQLCGAKRESDAIFCSYCGDKFDKNNICYNLK